MNEDTNINFNTLIAGQIETRAKWQHELSNLEVKVAMGTSTPADKLEIAKCKQKIKDADVAIAYLNKQNKEYNVATKTETQTQSLNEDREIVSTLIDEFNIGYLAEENKYVYCMGMERDGSDIVNPIFKLTEANRFGRVLLKMAKMKKLNLSKLYYKAFQEDLADHFQNSGKDYFSTTSSFHKDKWSEVKVYNKVSVIRKFWVQPAYDEEYDPRFDFLIHCVGGGKQENMDHLEKWIAYKWVYPERVGNIPNLDIGGYPGGNGKGRYIELCKTIFTNPCVVGAALKELMDGFNGTWEMATLLYYDEPAANELPEGKLKQATGGEDMRNEKKGIDATIVDRNYSILFVSNNPNGVVKLSGTGAGGEDRRYSVMITDKVMVDEAINLKLCANVEEAKVFVNSVHELVKNRKEVAKWLGHCIKAHNIETMNILHPLHGTDYKQRFEEQKSGVDTAFDLVLPVFVKTGCIPSAILHELVVAITGLEKYSSKKCTQQFGRYLAKNKIVFTLEKQRVKHLYNSEFVYEKLSNTFLGENKKMNFDHALISKSIPTSTTKYTSENITLGKDIEDDNLLNTENTVLMTPAEMVKARLQILRQK